MVENDNLYLFLGNYHYHYYAMDKFLLLHDKHQVCWLEWLKRHNYTPIKRVHVTKNYRRYRLIEPIEKYTSRTVHLGNEIMAIQII